MLMWYSQACQNTNNTKNWTKNSNTHAKMMKIINFSCKTRSYFLTSMISNQETLRYGTAMKLGFIPTEGGKNSSEFTGYFMVKECGMWKLDSKHHYGARYLYLSELMADALWHPSLCTKLISTWQISTSTYHWNIQSITHHLGIWIDTGGLNPRPNYPTYMLPPLSKTRHFYSMYMTVNSTTAHWYKWSTKTSNHLYWKQATQSTTSPAIMAQMPN